MRYQMELGFVSPAIEPLSSRLGISFRVNTTLPAGMLIMCGGSVRDVIVGVMDNKRRIMWHLLKG